MSPSSRTWTLIALIAVLSACSSNEQDQVSAYFQSSPALADSGWRLDEVRGDEGRYTATIRADDILPRPPASESLLRICPDADLDGLWRSGELDALAIELWDGGDRPRGRMDCPSDFSRAKLDQQVAARQAALVREQRAAKEVTPERKKILSLSYRNFNLEGTATYQGRWARLQTAAGRWYGDSRTLQVTFWPFRLTTEDVRKVSRERTLAGLNKPIPDGEFTSMPYAVMAVRFREGELSADNISGVTVDLYGWTPEEELLSFDLDPRGVFQQLQMPKPELGGAVHLRIRGEDKDLGMNLHATGIAPLLVADE